MWAYFYNISESSEITACFYFRGDLMIKQEQL